MGLFDGIKAAWHDLTTPYVDKLKEQEAMYHNVNTQNEIAECYYYGNNGTNISYLSAVYWFEKAANNGHASAQCNLGYCYEVGHGTDKNLELAFKWYRKSAENGNRIAQCNLGFFYEKGLGSEKDEKQAFEWYKKSADQDWERAQNNLGWCYENGFGTEKDEKQAFEWYKKSANQGYMYGQNNLGRCYQNGFGTEKDEKQAVYWYTMSANQGYMCAQSNLGWCYMHGAGTEKNESRGFEWTKKSAEQGWASAQCSIGYYYMNGMGIDKDESQGFQWSKKAAEQGNAQGQCNLGEYYQSGKGIEADENLAFEWCKKSAEQENANGLCTLGKYYRDGVGTKIDLNKAFELFEKSAEQNYKHAQYEMGNCYRNGTGVAKDEKLAFEWYQKSAEQDNANAFTALGECYYDGIGVEKNENDAFAWLKKAIEKENDKAYAWFEEHNTTDADIQYKIGERYHNGTGVEKDEKKAFEWYKKSAEQGNVDAQLEVAICYDEGEGIDEDKRSAAVWYRKLAEQGDEAAKLWLEEYENSIEGLLEKEEETHDAQIQCKIAWCYNDGDGIEKDAIKAFEWYTKSAEQGYAIAQHNLGICYETGSGTEKNLEKAFEWYTKAAEQGQADAQFNLGVCYANGDGTARDIRKAVEWIEKAADQGHTGAQNNLNKAKELLEEYENGIGGLLEKEAETHDAETQYKIAVCYEKGDGIEKDESKAFEWYKKSAEQGYADAELEVAICYDKGKGADLEKKIAIEWYKKAAGHGNEAAKSWIRKYENSIYGLLEKEEKTHDAETQYKIAVCYEKGKGIEKDESKAFEWYEKAVAQGNIKAIYRVGIVYYKKGEETKGRECIKKAADANLIEAKDWLSTHRETFKLEVSAKEAGAKIDELQDELLYSIKVTGECSEADFEAILDAVKYARYAQFDLDLSAITDIVSIPPSAFEECESLVSINLPCKLEKIQARTFLKCSNLAKVKIPYSVTSIEDKAFYTCTNLEEADIPNSAKSIGSQAFAFTKLSYVDIPKNSKIEAGAFEDIRNLKTITLYDGFDNDIFRQSRNIENFLILNSKETIRFPRSWIDGKCNVYVMPPMLEKYKGDFLFDYISSSEINTPEINRLRNEISGLQNEITELQFEIDYLDNNLEDYRQINTGLIWTDMMLMNERRDMLRKKSTIEEKISKMNENAKEKSKELNKETERVKSLALEKFSSHIKPLTIDLIPNIDNALASAAEISAKDALAFVRMFNITIDKITDSKYIYSAITAKSDNNAIELINELGITGDMISVKKKESVILPEMTIKEAVDYINALPLDDMNEYTFNLVGTLANSDIDMYKNFAEDLRLKFLSNISLDMSKMEMEKELIDSEITIICDSVKLPNTFKNANGSILFQCKKLVSAEIPNGTKIIGKVFVNCAKLENIDVPSSMREIKDAIVSDCPCLKSITIKATVPPRKHTAIYKNCEKLDAIYVPASSVQRYKDAEDWKTERELIKAIEE